MTSPNRSPLHEILERGEFSPTTQKVYASVIERWIAFAGSDPNGWTRMRAQEFYDRLLASGVRINTANSYMASLRYVSKWFSVRHNRPDLDFAIVQMRRGEPETNQRRALDEMTVRQLLAACWLPTRTVLGHRDFVMMIIGLETGMRRVSLAGMEFENLTTDRYPRIDVPIKGPAGTARFKVPLSDIAMLAIDSLPYRARKGFIVPMMQKRIKPSGLNEYKPNGKLSLQGIYEIVVERSQRAELPHIHPHLLRNTFITWRQKAKLTSVEIASITGHKTIPEWGEMAVYIDKAMIAANERVRNATPPWLATLVRQQLGG